MIADTTLFDHGILSNFNKARTKFLEFARKHFPSSVKNIETGKEIGIGRNGLDKFLSGNIPYEKYASGFHIPALIENAKKVGTANNYHTDTAGEIPTFEYFDSPIEIDGQEYNAHIRVKNTRVGDRYYGHTISTVENIEIERPTRISTAELPSDKPENTGRSISKNPQAGYNANMNVGPAHNAQGVLPQDFSKISIPQPTQAYNPNFNQNPGVDTGSPAGRTGTRQAIKKATGYGEYGASAFNQIVEDGGQSPDRVRMEFQSAYEAGLTNLPRERASLISHVQEIAYNAGRQDAIMSMKKATARGTTVWSKGGGLLQNEYTAKLDARVSGTLNGIGKATGTKIIVEAIPAEQNANGYYQDSDGTIHIDVNSTDPVMTVVKHELTHRMQALAPKEYRQFRDYAVQTLSSGLGYGNLSPVESIQRDYLERSSGNVRLSTEEAMDELAANFTEKILTDEDALRDFINGTVKSEDTRTMAQKFFDAVREFIQKVKRVFKGDKAKMDAAAQEQYGATISQLERAEQLWKETYTAATKAAQSAKNAPQTRSESAASVKYDLKGESFQEDKYFARQMDRWDDLADGNRVKVGIVQEGSALNHVGLPAAGMYFDVGKIKKAMGKHSDHLTPTVLKGIPDLLNDPVAISEYTGPNDNIKNTVNVYGNLFFDGKPVVVGIVMHLDRSGRNIINNIRTVHARSNFAKQITDASVLYLNENKKKTRKWFQVCGNLNVPLEGTQFGVIRSIAFDAEAVKAKDGVKFSLKDSAGRELTDEQKEFFKDSKIVDDNGNLLALYHGTTAYGEITKFKKGRSGWLGPGIYLSSRRNDAQKYADAMGAGNGTLYELYANVTNPLIVTSGNPVPEILKAAYGRDSVYAGRAKKQANDPHIITPADIKKLQSKGYDGIRWDFGNSTEVSVFSPEQVKRIDNQLPTSDPDIRFSLKGQSELLRQYMEQYGIIPEGEKPFRKVQLPKKTGENQRVSQTVRTVMEAKATPDEAIPDIEALKYKISYSYVLPSVRR